MAPVAADLRELNARLPGYLPTETASARAVIDHVFGAGGKRIRPALYYLCCELVGYRGEHYHEIAAVTEFVHTASLLHDDVVDDSTLRRNKPTANSVYGDETSVLVGDLIYSTASEMMAATGDMEIVKTFARAIRLMSDGELLQLENVFNGGVSEQVYLRILECKTAVLIEAACKSAGLLGRVSAAELQELCRFGRSVGLAFQLIDDALDYAGASDFVGKSTLADLRDGKVTMPVILLENHVTPAERDRLKTILSMPTVDHAAVSDVAALVHRYDTVEETIERAGTYTSAALAALMTFPASAARDKLENLTNKLLYRFH